MLLNSDIFFSHHVLTCTLTEAQFFQGYGSRSLKLFFKFLREAMKFQPLIKKGGNRMTYKVMFWFKSLYSTTHKVLSISTADRVPSGGPAHLPALAVAKSSCLFFLEFFGIQSFPPSSLLF